MASPARSDQGITLIELLVVLVIIGVLVSLAIPSVSHGPVRHGLLMQSINSERQIHLATMAMATDGETNKDAALGWPGDLKANGQIANLSDFANILVRNDYLKAADLKIFSRPPDFMPYQGDLSLSNNGMLIPAFKDENSAYKIYLVKKDDSSNTLFLASKYIYNIASYPKAKPNWDKGIVVINKGGCASIFKKSQAQNLSSIGDLPGGGTVESAENCLNPDMPSEKK